MSVRTELPGTTPGRDIAVAFLPAVVEQTLDQSVLQPRKRFLRATVTLAVGAESVTLPLPDLPVLVPALAIPKVLAPFLHAHFHATENGEPGGVHPGREVGWCGVGAEQPASPCRRSVPAMSKTEGGSTVWAAPSRPFRAVERYPNE